MTEDGFQHALTERKLGFKFAFLIIKTEAPLTAQRVSMTEARAIRRKPHAMGIELAFEDREETCDSVIQADIQNKLKGQTHDQSLT